MFELAAESKCQEVSYTFSILYSPNNYPFYKQAGKPTFGGFPCSGALTTANWRLSADASMLCDSVLMSAGQYTGTCNVMCAWHASIVCINQIVP